MEPQTLPEYDPRNSFLEEKAFKARTVFLFGTITDATASATARRLMALAAESNAAINVLVSSPGGHLESGESLHDIFHDDQPASDSRLADFLRDYPIKSKIVLAHLRKATQGPVTLSNCHPFQREWLGQPWVFATNGDLRNFNPDLRGPYLPVGTTDSESAFCWLMQELRRRFSGRSQPPAWQELAPHVAEIAEGIARHGNFNFLLSNGEALYAHCSSRLYALERRHPFPTATLLDCDMSLDLGALNAEGDRMVVIATEPLTAGEPWAAFEPGECKVFIDGAAAWRHRCERTQAFPVPAERVRAPAASSKVAQASTQ